MNEWWYGIVILVLAVLVGLFLADRQRRGRRDRERGGGPGADRNYLGEREDARQAGMSTEDRAWEAASQVRNQENQARGQAPARESAAQASADRAPDVV